MQNQNLNAMRHSCSHLLAAAILNLYPNTKLAIGPTTENGFYYDFDFEKPISEPDLPEIEEEMRKVQKQNLELVKREESKEKALQIEKNQPYKKELINELEDEKISFYKMGDFDDLCKGPHIANTKEIGPFKLLSVAGAYWHGDEKNKMLTRIYGTAFTSKEELNKYLFMLEEAKKRDHKKLGKELGLFIISPEVGQGLLIWTPKGAVIRREIEDFTVSEQTKRGYQHVYSPHIGKKSLWVTSGHWDLYRNKMYAPMVIDEEEYLVKPMNCPMHMMVYKSSPKSYKDLPLRIAENATVYRYEQPGELNGMLRVRYITQDDSHIFCRPDQVIDEFVGVIDYTVFLMKAFKITDFTFRISLRDPQNKDKYLGSDEVWEKAEKLIEDAVKKTGMPYEKIEGEAAFYGPKLDVIIKDALGREWQCGTVQMDFMLPDRFQLEYINVGNKTERPVVIHRAPLGSLERFTGMLIEHYAGAFPVWLSPVQAVIIPISEKHITYATSIIRFIEAKGIRIRLDDRSETMQSKIRDSQMQKIPYMLIVGDREEKSGEVSVRLRSGEDLKNMGLDKFTAIILKDIADKR